MAAPWPIFAMSAVAFPSAGFFTPKVTAWPSSAQRRPSVPPTEPMPMTAIFMLPLLVDWFREASAYRGEVLRHTHASAMGIWLQVLLAVEGLDLRLDRE